MTSWIKEVIWGNAYLVNNISALPLHVESACTPLSLGTLPSQHWAHVDPLKQLNKNVVA